jgi:DNA-binding beta-propeller fold protein YncE
MTAYLGNGTYGATVSVGFGLSQPYGVAVDGAGNVFIADTGNGRVVEVPSGCTQQSCQTTVGSHQLEFLLRKL